MIEVLRGGHLAEVLVEELANEVLDSKVTPVLAVLYTGPDSFILLRKKLGERIGIEYRQYNVSHLSQNHIIKMIKQLNHDDSVHGITVVRRLPKRLDQKRILEAISAEKEIEGYLPHSIYVNSTAAAIIALLDSYNHSLDDFDVLIVGPGNLIGPGLIETLRFFTRSQTIRYVDHQPHQALRADVIIVDRLDIRPELVQARIGIVDLGFYFDENHRARGAIPPSTIDNLPVAWYTAVPHGVHPVILPLEARNTIHAAVRASERDRRQLHIGTTSQKRSTPHGRWKSLLCFA